MKTVVVALVTVLLLASELSLGMASPSTAPAFLWSSHQDGLTNDRVQEAVSYRTLSPKDLAKSVMSEGGWSNLLCSGLESQQSVDLALLFVGKESLDISGNKHEDRALVDLLKDSFTRSNFSLAFPYVAASERRKSQWKYLWYQMLLGVQLHGIKTLSFLINVGLLWLFWIFIFCSRTSIVDF